MPAKKFVPYDNQKHGKYIVELKHGFSVFEQIKAPQIAALGEKDLGGAKFCIGYSFIEAPFTMVDEAHKHDFDQYLFLLGGNSANIDDFDAEIEIGLENKINLINYAACIHIIPGTMHGPVIIKKVNKPFVFMDIVLNTVPSVRPMPKVK
jgi:hypothetical protein